MKRRDGPQAALARLAATQDSLFTLQQAVELGLDDCWLSRQCRSGLILREHPRVYRYASAPRTMRQQLRAMTLRAPGKVWVSHRGAGGLWRLDEIPTDVLEVTTSTRIMAPTGHVIIHRVASIPPRDVTVVGASR